MGKLKVMLRTGQTFYANSLTHLKEILCGTGLQGISFSNGEIHAEKGMFQKEPFKVGHYTELDERAERVEMSDQYESYKDFDAYVRAIFYNPITNETFVIRAWRETETQHFVALKGVGAPTQSNVEIFSHFGERVLREELEKYFSVKFLNEIDFEH